MVALYPIVGGTADTHKFNLKDPRDLDAAYRLSYTGTVTHSSTGMVSNGSTGWANTHVVPSAALLLNDTHLSTYLRTNFDKDQSVEMGITNAANSLFIAPKYTAALQNFRGVNASQTSAQDLADNVVAFWQPNRISSTQSKQYRNGVVYNTDNVNSGGLSNYPITVFGYWNGSSQLFISNRETAFVSIGRGMTDDEATTFYNIVVAYQTTLGRNV